MSKPFGKQESEAMDEAAAFLRFESDADTVRNVAGARLVAGLPPETLFGEPPVFSSYLERVVATDRDAVRSPKTDDEGRYSIAYHLRGAGDVLSPVVEYGRIVVQDGRVLRRAMFADAPAHLARRPGHETRQQTLVRLATHPAVVRGLLDEAIHAILAASSEALEVARVSYWTVAGGAASRLSCRWVHETGKGARESTAVLGQTEYPFYVGALLEGRALAVNDAMSDVRTSEFLPYLALHGITSLVDAPIRAAGEVVGILCFEHTGPLRAWQAEEIAFASEAADLAAQVVLNARSVDAVKQKATLEAQLARAERLEAVGRLAGGVAHDFNNVLFAMLTNIEFARGEITNEHPAHGYLADAETAGWGAADLVRRLLAFSRRQVMMPTLVDLHVLVEELGRMLRRLVPESIELVVERGAGAGLLRGDRSQLEQIVVNLVVNAGHAIGQRGRIEITTGRASGPAGEQGLVLDVADSGPGVPEPIRERIFEPFFTTRSGEGGTGLGLATVFGVVRQHKGNVLVADSALGGALFRVWLPAVDMTEAPPTHERTPRPSAAPAVETILLAEDEELVRTATRRLLERAGYRVIEAKDGVEAIEAFRAASPKPGLVVLDAVMPRLGGRETYDAIRKTGERPRFLLVTGYDVDETLLDAEDVVVMNKPYGTNDLLRAVERLVRS